MAKNSDDYAIVIGIDTYPLLNRLNSAHSDATLFAEWLAAADGGNLPESNIYLMTGPPEIPIPGSTGWSPIHDDVDDKLRRMGVADNRRIGRRLYFYFAGHGFGPDFDEVGLLMIDAAETNLNANLGYRPYRDFFDNNFRFDEIVYIFDCCRDASPLDKYLQLRNPGFTLGVTQIPNTRPRDFVLMASASWEKAYAVNSKVNGNEYRGLLTKVLLKGLREADDGNRRVTAASLSNYIVTEVEKEAKSLKLKQNPQVPTWPPPEIVFATLLPDLTTFEVRVIAGPARKGILTLYDKASGPDPIDSCAAKNATEQDPWILQLSRNSAVYIVQHSTSQETREIITANIIKEPLIVRFD